MKIPIEVIVLVFLALAVATAIGIKGGWTTSQPTVEATKIKTTLVKSPFGDYTATDVHYGSGYVSFKSNGMSMTLYGNMLLIESDAQ